MTRSGRMLVATLMLVSLGLGAAGGLVLSDTATDGFLIGLIALWCAAAVFYSATRLGSMLAPPAVIAAAVGLLYVGRSLWDLTHHTLDSGARVDQITIVQSLRPEIASALALVVLALFCMTLGWMLVVGGRLEPSGELRQVDQQGRSARYPARIGYSRLQLMIAGSAAIIVATNVYLLHKAGGLHALIDALANRSGFFFGEGFLTLDTFPLTAVLLVSLADAVRDPVAWRRIWKLWVVGAAILVGPLSSSSSSSPSPWCWERTGGCGCRAWSPCCSSV
jgi:hypothetical protein